MTFDTLLNCLLWWWLTGYMWAVCIMTFDTLLNCLLWWWLTGYMWAVCIMTFDTFDVKLSSMVVAYRLYVGCLYYDI